MEILLIVLFACGWYMVGILGIMIIFAANKEWKFITRFQLFWILVLWAFTGPFMMALGLIILLVEGLPDSNFWERPVYIKEKHRKYYSDN